MLQISITDESDFDSSPSTPRNQQGGDEVTTASLSASPSLPLNTGKKRSGGKLHFGKVIISLKVRKKLKISKLNSFPTNSILFLVLSKIEQNSFSQSKQSNYHSKFEN